MTTHEEDLEIAKVANELGSYDLETVGLCYQHYETMVKQKPLDYSYGEYVRTEDAAKMILSLRREIEQLKATLVALNV